MPDLQAAREAAERFSKGDYQEPDGATPVPSLIDDCVTLAKVAVAILSRPADYVGELVGDKTPIDEEWLREAGFASDQFGVPTLGPIHIQLNNRTSSGGILPPYACVRSLPISVSKTRADVRQLCQVLGVNLKESNPTR